jgi:hypothetical protein
MLQGVSISGMAVRLINRRHHPLDRETLLSTLLTKIIAAARVIGPYAAIELLLPGGSLIAILLWIYRNNQSKAELGACDSPQMC